MNLSQNCRLLSIRYKCRMIRLTDEQWERIRDHFPEENIADGRPGRRPIPTRYVLEAVLWILNTGAQWHMLPQSYPNYKTVHRRFQSWCHNEVLRQVRRRSSVRICITRGCNQIASCSIATSMQMRICVPECSVGDKLAQDCFDTRVFYAL